MRLIPALVMLAAASMPSAKADLVPHDRRFDETRGPRAGSRASWYYNPEMTAAELVKRAAHSRRARRTHRGKRSKRARF